MTSTMNRRSFLSQAGLAAGVAAATARSYTRVLGANDRISLGHIGVGNRGRGLARIAAQLKQSTASGLPKHGGSAGAQGRGCRADLHG